MHGGGARRVGLDQVLNTGQRIEQKVRLHLRLHGGHARLHHLALERLGFGHLGGGSGNGLSLDATAVSDFENQGGKDQEHGQVGQAVAALYIAFVGAKVDVYLVLITRTGLAFQGAAHGF